MLIRIRSKDGNFRFELAGTSDASELAHKILETTVDAVPSTITISERPRGGETNLNTLAGRTLQELGLKHGDLLFVAYNSAQDEPISQTITTNGASHLTDTSPSHSNVREDAIDSYWKSKDGKIPRSRDSRFCHHGPNGMCDYCMPLEPFDSNYHATNNIKHLSFHTYLRKIAPRPGTSAASLPPLTPLSYRVKNPCPNGGHSPWPAGICTTCQPSAITLQPPVYRMVDHLEFADPQIMDRFLGAWRDTGVQRFGWLLGHYEPYDEVPMGIKAVVEAIHEPPQEGEVDGLTLGLPWEDESRVCQLAASTKTPLLIVGQIFTDLTPTPDDRTKLIFKRHQESYFLSSLEVIWAAKAQLRHPNASRSSSTGQFGSRLVTAVCCGTQDGGVDVQAYQVSEQACAMVEADMIEASVEPGLVRVKEEDTESARYVPDVFFRYKNEYGLDVKKSAKPCFPVEYLLVTVTHGFPKNPSPMFRSTTFPVENRPGLEDQDAQLVLKDLHRLQAADLVPSIDAASQNQRSLRLQLAQWISDWHLLSFLETMELLSHEEMEVLAKTASAPDLEVPEVVDELLGTNGWQTLVTIARESGAPQRPSAPAPAQALDQDPDIPPDLFDDAMGVGSENVVCPHCTFENTHSGGDCDVCGLPLS